MISMIKNTFPESSEFYFLFLSCPCIGLIILAILAGCAKVEVTTVVNTEGGAPILF